MDMTITSPAFAHLGPIPTEYTCDGSDISPPLEWAHVPERARSLALIVDDPDAPDPAAPKTIWVHWVLYNIPPNATHLVRGVQPYELPAGTSEGTNDWQESGYRGPCPPVGRHRYFFKLYALDTVIGKLAPTTKSRLEKAMKGHVIAAAEIVGTYQRAQRHKK